MHRLDLTQQASAQYLVSVVPFPVSVTTEVDLEDSEMDWE